MRLNLEKYKLLNNNICYFTGLIFCPRTADSAEERTELFRLVVPELLQQYFFTPLSHKFKRRASRGGPHLSKNPLELSLKRFIPECPTLCGRMC